MKNYVPYEDYPDGKAAAEDTVTVESDTTGEEKRREEEKGEKENKGEAEVDAPSENNKDNNGTTQGGADEKWKDNYVPYNEEDKE